MEQIQHGAWVKFTGDEIKKIADAARKQFDSCELQQRNSEYAIVINSKDAILFQRKYLGHLLGYVNTEILDVTERQKIGYALDEVGVNFCKYSQAFVSTKWSKPTFGRSWKILASIVLVLGIFLAIIMFAATGTIYFLFLLLVSFPSLIVILSKPKKAGQI